MNHISAIQVDWLVEQGFGGWMTWCLDLDDFTGNFCNQGKYPLLTKMNNALGFDIPTPAYVTQAFILLFSLQT